MKITIEIPDERIAVAIKEARIAYWCRERALVQHVDGDRYVYTCHDDPEPYPVSPAALAEALGIMATDPALAWTFARLLSGRGDGTVGDCLVQLAAFGELRYG